MTEGRRKAWLCAIALGCSLICAPTRADDKASADAAKLLAAGKSAEAEAAYRAILKAHPDDPTALEGLGNTLTAERKFEESATTFEHLADVMEKRAAALQNRAKPAAAPTTPAPSRVRRTAAPPATPTPFAAPPPATPAADAKPAGPSDTDVAAATALNPTKGDHQFTGLYVQQRMLFFGRSSSLEYVLYYFFPDGHCFLGTPPGGTVVDHPGDAEWQALVKADPKHCATYVQSGDAITFQRAGGTPETKKFSLKPGEPGTLVIDTLSAVKRDGFRAGSTMDAKYEGGSTMTWRPDSPREAFLAVSGSFDFHPDGSFTKENAAAYDAKPNSTSTVNAQQGTYKLAGNTLELTLGGETVKYTVFAMREKDEDPPLMFWMNGRMFNKTKR